MAETKMAATKKKKQKKKTIGYIQLLKMAFLIAIALLIVYLYYLQTKGTLASTLLSVWKSYQKYIMGAIAFIAYTWWIYSWGYRRGKGH